jgi:hypothetical protein
MGRVVLTRSGIRFCITILWAGMLMKAMSCMCARCREWGH